MTKIQFERYFATTFRHLTKNKLWFYDTGALLVHFNMLAPNGKCHVFTF
jgi:hypothetical protein